MNTQTATTVAAALALSLGLASVQADAATSRSSNTLHLKETATISHRSGTVIHLGTITVTPPKAAAKVDFSKTRGSTAYLGMVSVTTADSVDARLAARAAKSQGALFLGVVQVSRQDSLDARYAQRLADERGAAYLGTVQVTPTGLQSRTLAGLVNLERRLGDNVRFVMLGTLAFDRAGG